MNQERVDSEDLGVSPYNPSIISADFLANFMSKRKYLESIIGNMAFTPRYYPEHVNYLNLKYGETAISRLIIPMTCFCDIKLHQISCHAEGVGNYNGYGKFAIIMKKEWGVHNGVQPVQYVTKGSLFQRQFSKSFNLYMKTIENSVFDERIDERLDKIADVLLEQARFMKPLFGEMPKDKKIISDKNFTDEKEWRFVPDVPDDKVKSFYIDPLDGLKTSQKGIELANEAIKLIKDVNLKFQVSDVKYIFVETADDAENLTDFILRLKGNRISKKNKLKLIQKILIYDETKGDF